MLVGSSLGDMTNLGGDSDDIFEAAVRRHSKKKKTGATGDSNRPSFPSDHVLKIDNFTTNFTVPPTGLPPPPASRPRTQLRMEAGAPGQYQQKQSTSMLLSGYQPSNGRASEPKGFLAEVAATRDARGDVTRNPVPLFEEDAHRQGSRTSVPPVVQCQVNGTDAHALLNTVSVISCVSRQFLAKLDLIHEIIPEPNPPRHPLHLATGLTGNGATFGIEGKVKYIEVNLGGIKQVCQLFVLRDSPIDVQLGVDFLKRAQIYMSFPENCVHVGGPNGAKVTLLGSKEILQITKSNAKYVSSTF